jgi:hypothetical protein
MTAAPWRKRLLPQHWESFCCGPCHAFPSLTVSGWSERLETTHAVEIRYSAPVASHRHSEPVAGSALRTRGFSGVAVFLPLRLTCELLLLLPELTRCLSSLVDRLISMILPSLSFPLPQPMSYPSLAPLPSLLCSPTALSSSGWGTKMNPSSGQ